MNFEETEAAYARSLTDLLTFRRYTGTGVNRQRFDATDLKARITDYKPSELLGTITQGDQRAIVLARDIINSGFALPVTTGDKVVLYGKEHAIISVDGNTRRVEGQLVAYEIQIRG